MGWNLAEDVLPVEWYSPHVLGLNHFPTWFNHVQSCCCCCFKKNSLVQLLFDFIPQVLVGQPCCWQKFYSPQQHVNIFLEQSPRHPDRISSFAGVSTLPTCDWWIQVATSLFDQLNVPVDIQSVNSITAKKTICCFSSGLSNLHNSIYSIYIYVYPTKCLPTHICPLVLLRITLLANSWWFLSLWSHDIQQNFWMYPSCLIPSPKT